MDENLSAEKHRRSESLQLAGSGLEIVSMMPPLCVQAKPKKKGSAGGPSGRRPKMIARRWTKERMMQRTDVNESKAPSAQEILPTRPVGADATAVFMEIASVIELSPKKDRKTTQWPS